MSGSFWTALTAGVLCALLLGVIEALVGLGGVTSSGAGVFAMLAAPLFYAALSLPLIASVTTLLGLWVWFFTGKSPAELRESWRRSQGRLAVGELAWPGYVLALFLMAGGVVGLGTAVHVRFDSAFQNRVLEGVLLSAIVLLLSFVWAGVVLGSVRRLGRAVLWLRARVPTLSALLSGPFLLALLLFFAAALSIIFAIRHQTLLIDIGEDRIAWLLGVPLFVASVWALLVWTAPPWVARWPIRGVVLVIAASALPVAFWLGASQDVRMASLGTRGPGARLVSFYQQLTDFDGDGSSAHLGGGDCAPDDRAIGPHADEVPGNGIDENCVGGDAEVPSGSNPLAYVPLPTPLATRPNIVLITVDALRADHMSLYGYDRETTPRIDRHAQSAIVFERCYSQGTGTIPAMPSMFASRQPYQVIYDDARFPPTISQSEKLLPEYLSDEGYRTLGISTIRYTNNRRWGLIQGFDEVDLSLTAPDPAFEVTTDTVLEKALALVEREREAPVPVFLWVHFFDVHTEYLPWDQDEQPFGDRRMDRYDGEILRTDAGIGRLLDVVLADDAPPTIVVLAADHGDGFPSDHGRTNHGYGLYHELLHTPLVIWMPGAEGRRVTSPVANLDILPTLLSAIGVAETSLEGNSLVPYIYEGFEDPERMIISEKIFQRGARRSRKSIATQKWRYTRWITEDAEYLFDLENDPAERQNVIRAHPEVAERFRQAMDEFIERESIGHRERAAAAGGEAFHVEEPPSVRHMAQTSRRGGVPGPFDCPADHTITSVEATANDRALAAIRVHCTPLPGVTGAPSDRLRSRWRGARRRDAPRTVGCREGDVAIGLHGHATRFVESVGLICLSSDDAEGESGSAEYRSEIIGTPEAQQGQAEGSAYELRCPDESYLWGYRGRSGALIDAVGIACVER